MTASRRFALLSRQRSCHGRYVRICVAALTLIVLLFHQRNLLSNTHCLISVLPVGITSPNDSETTFKCRYPMVQNHVDITTSETTPRCDCVRCCEDELCGGLWAGSIGRKHGDASRFRKISLVISHCLHDLHWLDDFVRGYDIHDIVIYSKCGKKVVGAPPMATVVNVANNVGRNDQTFAQHMVNILKTPKSQSDTDIADEDNAVIFLKDSRQPVHQPGGRWRPFGDMLRIMSVSGFACGMELTVTNPVRAWTTHPISGKTIEKHLLVSAFHKTHDLGGFQKDIYFWTQEKYNKIDMHPKEPFKSQHSNLIDWIKSIPFNFPHNTALVQVCYGGSFGTTVAAIRKHPQSSWESLSRSLSRADNLEEGHFAERSWAGLLAKPIQPYQAEALLQFIEQPSPTMPPDYVRGALAVAVPPTFAYDQLTFLEKCSDEHN